ncbi:MAG: DNA polymerase III subunit alpha [Terriglobales bacterium]
MSDVAVPFVHLHVHSDYSLLDGACDVTKLVARAAALAQPAVALTDHGNLFGAVAFQRAAQAAGIQPILGCELYIAKQADHRAAPSDVEAGSGAAGPAAYNHLIVLCENETGYRNLVKIVSEASLHGFYYKPRVSKAFLAEHSAGLIALSACLKGEVQECLTAGHPEDAERAAGEYRDMFGSGNFFLEIQNQDLEQERRIQSALLRLGERTGLPLVATNDCHYLQHDDARMHDVLLCIQTGKRVQDERRMRFGSDQFYLKSGAEMLRMFSGIEHAVHRTAEIAARCQCELRAVDSPFPQFEVPGGETLDGYLARIARQGLAQREAQREARRAARRAAGRAAGRSSYTEADYAARLEQELGVIAATGYAGYFLIVWDFIRFAREQGIPVGLGRGSAVGSLVSYALGITGPDPLEHELIFERFLNTERVSMPDIDIDFCMRRRGEVIEYVTQKYGRDNVSQIITFGTLGAKAAIKDVGRAMDLPYGEVDRLAKLIPAQPLNIRIAEALETSPELARLRASDARVAELLDVAQRVEGLCRHAGMHAAGVVIAPRPLTELVPLYKTSRDEIVTQFDMEGLEKIGLLKMDFLGLTTLTILADAERWVRLRSDPGFSLEALPEDDPATYALFCKGATGGIFQFESTGMRDVLKRYRPERLSDLTALNALYRPGPMQMIDDFIARKQGRKAIRYELPELEPILAETLGVFLYQEQVMQAAHQLAGYSLGEADLLRRAMGKKKPEEMNRQRETFIAGATARGLPRGAVEHIFDLMAQFAGYGFNKSHAAAYAELAYRCAYLKAHYPVAFMAALLSCCGDSDSVVKYIGECRLLHVPVLPPDIHHSEAHFTPGDGAIRFGLGAIKNVGEAAVETILRARAGGPFTSLADFCRRAGGRTLNKRVLESLMKSGALDALAASGPAAETDPGAARAALMAGAEAALEAAQREEKRRASPQHGLPLLFAGDLAAAPAPALPAAAPWDESQRLAGEKEVLGYYVTGHPLDRHADLLADLGTVALEDLAARRSPGREEFAVAGMVSGLQIKRNKKGESWAVAKLEDRTGRAEVLCFAEAFRRLEPVLRVATPLWLRVRLASDEETERLQLSDAQELTAVRPVLPSALQLRLDVDDLQPEQLDALRQLLASRPGSAKIHLHARSGREAFEQILELDAAVAADAGFRRAAEQLCGPGCLHVVA